MSRMLAMAAVLIVAGVAGCGGTEDIGAQNTEKAVQLSVEIDVHSTDRRGTDVVCSRPRPGRFECRAYKITPTTGSAEAAFYRLIDCGNSQWRAILDEGSSSGFPTYLTRDTDSELIKSECIDLDKRYP